MHYGIHYRWNIYDYYEVPHIYIEWNEKDQDRVPLYNESFSFSRLIGCYSHECPKKLEMRDKKRKEKLFWKMEKYSSWIVVICCHSSTNTFIIFPWVYIGDKGHKMRIQISMPIYNSIVWLIHSLMV